MIRLWGVAWQVLRFILKILPVWLLIARSKDKDKYYSRIAGSLFDLFSALSGTFIKFGQILSMRPDLLPEAICLRLSDLLDAAPPESFEDSLRTLSEEFKTDKPLDHFATFSAEPVAAASFATVYLATLPDGTSVAVKVQRRGLSAIVDRDIRILRFVSSILDATGVLYRFKARAFVEDFAAWTLEELDYRREARSQTRIRETLGGATSSVFIPAITWRLTTSRVLTSDFVAGKWISRIIQDRNSDIKTRQAVAAQLFFSMLEQVFEHGFFHADPHAGNICLQDDGSIAMIDFGIVGYLSSDFRRHQLSLLNALQSEDVDQAFTALQAILVVPPDANLQNFRVRVERNIRDWTLKQYQPQLRSAERSAGGLLLQNFRAAREAGVYFSSQAARYYRAFVVLDSVIVSLDDHFDHRTRLREYFQKRDRRVISGHAASMVEQIPAPADNLVSRMIEIFPIVLQQLERVILQPPSFEGVFREAHIIVSRFASFFSRLGGLVWIASLALLLLTNLPGNAWTSAIKSHLGQDVTDHLQLAFWVGLGIWTVCGWLSRFLWINAYVPGERV